MTKQSAVFVLTLASLASWIRGMAGLHGRTRGIVPWALYGVYGDKAVLEKQYDKKASLA